MSPEHFRGDAPLDGRGDVYALGVMLHEMLCGQPPFSGNAERLAWLHIFQEAPLLHKTTASVPKPVAMLVRRMLDKALELRPTMTEVVENLARLMDNAPGEREANLGSHHDSGWRGTRFARYIVMPLLLLLLIGGVRYRLLHLLSSMVLLQGGQFLMGSTEREVHDALYDAQQMGSPDLPRNLYERETPARQVIISSFYMDVTEVTNRQFAAWLSKQRVLVDPDGRIWLNGKLIYDLFMGNEKEGKDHNGILYIATGRFEARVVMEQMPVVYLTWDGAQLYCQSQGKRLPTEAEWEFAARGNQRRRFPWGDMDPNCRTVAFGRDANNKKCRVRGAEPSDVGTMKLDRTPEGIYDMGGNVAEWVQDRFLDRYGDCNPDCKDPQGPPIPLDDNSDLHVIRGGSWFREAEACRAAGRSRSDPRRGGRQYLSADVGFRCAQPIRR